jgi:hypothetical protein
VIHNAFVVLFFTFHFWQTKIQHGFVLLLLQKSLSTLDKHKISAKQKTAYESKLCKLVFKRERTYPKVRVLSLLKT